MADMGTDTCHLGLMSFATPTTQILMSNVTGPFPNETARDLEIVTSAVGATRWSEIRFGATFLFNTCMIRKRLGGFKIVNSGMISNSLVLELSATNVFSTSRAYAISTGAHIVSLGRRLPL